MTDHLCRKRKLADSFIHVPCEYSVRKIEPTSSCVHRYVWSQVARWVKRWPADQVVPGSTPTGSGNLFNRKRGSIAHSVP